MCHILGLFSSILLYSQVFDMTLYDSISICLQLLASVPHNHLLSAYVTSSFFFFLLYVFPSFILLQYLAVNSDASKYVQSNDVSLLDDFQYLSILFHFANTSLLGPFHGAIAVPSVTRCRCRGHRCAGGVRQYR